MVGSGDRQDDLRTPDARRSGQHCPALSFRRVCPAWPQQHNKTYVRTAGFMLSWKSKRPCCWKMCSRECSAQNLKRLDMHVVTLQAGALQNQPLPTPARSCAMPPPTAFAKIAHRPHVGASAAWSIPTFSFTREQKHVSPRMVSSCWTATRRQSLLRQQHLLVKIWRLDYFKFACKLILECFENSVPGLLQL